jgi:hypothetical protein
MHNISTPELPPQVLKVRNDYLRQVKKESERENQIKSARPSYAGTGAPNSIPAISQRNSEQPYLKSARNK